MEEKNTKSGTAQKEEKILEFWKENNIFQKSLEKDSPQGDFVFYEGPPTANAKPALHHLEARAFKDILPRYKTMRGFRVRRKAGWDTHGLPVELQIEKKLGLTSKKDIEQYGVEEFNKQCKESVLEYIGEWEKFTDRIGYWVDKASAYYTFNPDYMESLWNIVKTIYDKNLLYKDYKVLPWCPRCGTALSSHELAQGYQDDKDLSVYAKFKVVGEENTYILAWTTTPWTLPGNVALAVGEDIEYVKVKLQEQILFLAKSRLSILDGDYEIVKELKGKDLIGFRYEPLYPFFSQKFSDKNPEAFEKAYQVYAADFVDTETGTGIVHTAVMYGQDDFVLGTKIGLPKYHLVTEDGHFFSDMGFLSGRFVKDEEVAVDVIKDLAHRGLLFKKEKYEHSYPHCWRCKTPLIYYARDSWYIAMSTLRDELVSENEGIHWEPAHIRDGRFGEWLREIKDWAISRERYWGTPLPIWQDAEGNTKVMGSVDDLRKHTKKSGNTYFVMRHGQTESNITKVWDCDINNHDPITEHGKAQAQEGAETLKDKSINLIISSPYERTKETAEIVAKELDVAKEDIVFDSRVGEWNVGKEFNGKPIVEFLTVRHQSGDKHAFKSEDGESYEDVMRRCGEFLYELETKYEGRNILIVSHGAPSRALNVLAQGVSRAEILKRNVEFSNFVNGEVRELDFTPVPHNENYELDLHRPFIDAIELVDEAGSPLTRVKEVMDVWFDSGSMPFAQDHYPFEGKELIYPADYISEAIDQTRGWFYTLHAVGILMGFGKAYKNVVCLGHILDSQGKKMSKSIGNIVNPIEMVDKYGVDALRLWMYSVNQPGDSKNFDEKTVDEIIKKVFNPLENILAFYDMYSGSEFPAIDKSEHVLDRWILARLHELISLGTTSLDSYKVFEAARAIREFVTDFSTWYVRRSRDRFKSDDVQEKSAALGTTRFVCLQLAEYMAPFTPFFAESTYLRLRGASDSESVHLCEWPKGGEVDTKLLDDMKKARTLVSRALEDRQASGLKVRQPLPRLTIDYPFSQEMLNIIRDEVNVKNIDYVTRVEPSSLKITIGEISMELDKNLTNELIEEGRVRDIIRTIQDWRKEKNLTPGEKVSYEIPEAERELFGKYAGEIKRVTNVEF